MKTQSRKKQPATKRTRRARKTSCPWQRITRTGSNLHIQDFVTFRLTRLSNALRNNLTKPYLEEFELSLPEWRLLALVNRFTPVRFSELTQRSSMDKGQVSRTLRVMAKRGIVNMKTLKQKGRAAEALAAPVMVYETAKGRALYKAILPVAQRRQAELLSVLSQTERVALYQTLDKLYAHVGGTPDEGDEA